MNPPTFVEHCQELLGALGAVHARRMFGGWGLSVDGLFLALIIQQRLYLKTNPGTQQRFAAADGEAFVFSSRGKVVTTSYWTAPHDAMDSPALLLPWARLAQQAALAARIAKVKVKVKPPGRAATRAATTKAATKPPHKPPQRPPHKRRPPPARG